MGLLIFCLIVSCGRVWLVFSGNIKQGKIASKHFFKSTEGFSRLPAYRDENHFLVVYEPEAVECQKAIAGNLSGSRYTESPSFDPRTALAARHYVLLPTVKAKLQTLQRDSKQSEADAGRPAILHTTRTNDLEIIDEISQNPQTASFLEYAGQDQTTYIGILLHHLKFIEQESVYAQSGIAGEKLLSLLKSTPCVQYAAFVPKASSLQSLERFKREETISSRSKVESSVRVYPDDPLIRSQWWYAAQSGSNASVLKGANDGALNANLQRAHQLWTGEGSGYKIIVLDTGCDLEHPDMFQFQQFDSFAFNSREAGGTGWDFYKSSNCSNGVDDDGNGVIDDCFGVNWNASHKNPWDISGHGTHVAGIIASATDNDAYTASACPGCRVLCVAPIAYVVETINFAINEKIKIVNWSGSFYREGLSEDFSSIVEHAIRKYGEKVDGLWVCAAGNKPVDLDKCLSPSAAPRICFGYDDSVSHADYHFGFPCELSIKLNNILCVGSSNEEGMASYFSTYGKKSVNVFAPGQEILSHAPVYSGNLVKIMSGTSMASPIVAGIAGLVRSKFPYLTATQTIEAIERSCNPSEDLLAKTKCKGVVDAVGALTIAASFSLS